MKKYCYSIIAIALALVSTSVNAASEKFTKAVTERAEAMMAYAAKDPITSEWTGTVVKIQPMGEADLKIVYVARDDGSVFSTIVGARFGSNIGDKVIVKVVTYSINHDGMRGMFRTLALATDK